MKKNLLVVFVLLFLQGCSPFRTIEFNPDIQTVQEMPKELAMNYLAQLRYTVDFSSDHPAYKSELCSYDKKGVINPWSNNKTMKYEDLQISGQEIWFVGDESHIWLDIRAYTPHDQPCRITWHMFNKTDVQQINELANKVATALQSLGVKIEEK